MIDTNETRIRNLIDQLNRERRLTRNVIDAALDLKAVSGDPTLFLLQAGQCLQKAIDAYNTQVRGMSHSGVSVRD